MQSIGNIRTTDMYLYKLDEVLDPITKEFDSIRLKECESIKTDKRAIFLVDKKPKWSTAKNKYVYNFNGR